MADDTLGVINERRRDLPAGDRLELPLATVRYGATVVECCHAFLSSVHQGFAVSI